MASECSVKILSKLTGLDKDVPFAEAFAATATLTKGTLNRQIQTTGGTEEALNVCGISTVELIIIKASSNDLIIDTSYAAATFSTEIVVPEGEVAIFKPGGTVYIKNEDGTEECTVDYLIVGSA